MNTTNWESIPAHQLEQKHVGRLVHLEWTDGQSVTGRLAVLQFAHRHTFYQGGTKELQDRHCKIILEVGDEDLELDLPLGATVAVQG